MSETGLPPNLAAINAVKPMAGSNLQGKIVPSADALLNRAHRDAMDRGFVIVGSRSEILTSPVPPNMYAEVRVTVLMKSLYEAGQPIYEFAALGAADVVTGARVNGHILSLAETRARTRALGFALNTDEENAGTNATAAPQGAYAAPQAYGAPAGLPAGAPMAPSQPGVYQGFPNGIVPMGKHKGKHLTDPSITMADLQWFTTLTQQDRVTPDLAKRNDALAEMQRRGGGGGAPVAPAAYAPVPVAAAPAAYAPAPPGFAPAPLPPAPGAAAFPAAPYAPVPMAPAPVVPAPVAAPVQDPNALGRIAQLAASKNYAWPQLVAYVAQTFGVPDPAQLQPAQLVQLEQSFQAL